MRQEFLSQVAELYLENDRDRLRDYLFVFPNRRSSVFFQRYLGELSGEPIFSPDITTINNLFSSLSGFVTADKLELLYILYTVYKKYVKSCQESFDEFLFWGDTILNDFDDVDKYLVDAKKLFTNISDLKEMDDMYSYLSKNQLDAIYSFWRNFDGYKIPDTQPDEQIDKKAIFVQLWQYMYSIYSDFKETLLEKGIAYEGMIYRSVAENVEKTKALDSYRCVVFVGFNALNECEKKFLDELNKQGRAHFYWDYFGNIIKNPENKSSFFMSDNVKRFKAGYELSVDGCPAENQKIKLIGIPSMVGQTKYLPNILKTEVLAKENKEKAALNTAIVLPEEKLLLPVLNSIPNEISKINVTMGYSLSNSNCASFMDSYAQLHLRSSFRKGKLFFYFRNVQNILNHPYILSNCPKTAAVLKQQIVNSNMIYVDADIFTRLSSDDSLISAIFDKKNFSDDYKNIALAQYSFLEVLHPLVDELEGEFIYHYRLAITRILNLQLPIMVKTYFKLLRDAISMVQIPFKGEPLSGLQVMGNLEMRALDFENLIILSVNDGIFPSRSVSNSMIPYNLRVGFGLPSYEYQDAISAYHFYRSIYRAKNIYLLYDTRSSTGTNVGELSRFVKQLKYQHNISIEEILINHIIPSVKLESEDVPKSPDMFEKIDKITYSATAINTYLDCQKKFYYQNVEGIREADDVSENVEANVFGTLYHKIMEIVYSPFEAKVVNVSDIDNILKSPNLLSDYIASAFRTEAHIDEVLGKNKIIEALLFKFVKASLNIDKSNCPFTYLKSETRCDAKLEISSDKAVSIKGYIDRMDVLMGNLRLIDYKTGGSEINFKSVAELFDSSNANRPYTALQLMFYLLLLRKDVRYASKFERFNAQNVSFMVYSLKNLFDKNFPSFMIEESDFKDFEASLVEMIKSIYDLNIPFKATDNLRKCSYCPYKLICKR